MGHFIAILVSVIGLIISAFCVGLMIEFAMHWPAYIFIPASFACVIPTFLGICLGAYLID